MDVHGIQTPALRQRSSAAASGHLSILKWAREWMAMGSSSSLQFSGPKRRHGHVAVGKRTRRENGCSYGNCGQWRKIVNWTTSLVVPHLCAAVV